jgi:hypothetical protein
LLVNWEGGRAATVGDDDAGDEGAGGRARDGGAGDEELDGMEESVVEELDGMEELTAEQGMEELTTEVQTDFSQTLGDKHHRLFIMR